MVRLSGGCLCGAVRYEAEVEAVRASLCHCTHCQKVSGSAFSVNVIAPADKVTFSGAAPSAYVDSAESGRKLRRLFCPTCGSSLASEAEAFPGMIILKAGTLDDRSAVTPVVNIWTRSAQPWVIHDPALKSFERGRT